MVLDSVKLLPDDPELVPLNELARRLPQRLSPPTLWRWVSRGRKGVRLPVIKIGRTVYLTPQVWAEFLNQSTERSYSRPADPIPEEHHAATEAELRRRGFKLGSEA